MKSASKVRPPSGCVEAHPNSRTMLFGGRFINVAMVARVTHISHSHVWRIFEGKRTPSVRHSELIAVALGLGLEEFLLLLKHRLRQRSLAASTAPEYASQTA